MKRIFFALCLLLLPALASAATVSSISIAGNTWTVNATAHGLVVNQGFCITGSSVTADNQCGVVNTVPNANSITFNLAGGQTCAATCGAINAAKQIMVLKTDQPSQATTVIHYIQWLTTRQGLINAGGSAWPTATTAEVAAIARGEFVEVRRSIEIPSNLTIADMRTLLRQEYIAQQAQLATNIQPGQYTGAFFDGVSWQ